MKRLPLTRIFLLAVFSSCTLASQGCSSSPSSVCARGPCIDAGATLDGGNGAAPLATVCTEFNAAVCAFLARCGSVSSEAACRALNVASSTCLYAQKKAVAHGRATFDAAGTASCLQALRTTAACTLPAAGNRGYPDCPAFDHNFILGLVPDQGTCFQSDECSPSSYCTADGPTGTCPGICVPRNAAGAHVQVSVQCQAGLYDYLGACAPLVPSQQSCAASSGANAPQTCVAGNFCDGASSTCAPLHSAGQTCRTGAECDGLTGCDGTVCQPPVPVGAACGGSVLRFCQADLTCLSTQANGANPTCRAVSATAPCRQSFDCGVGYFCSGGSASTLGTCVLRAPAGSACTSTPSCGADLYCDSSGHCAPQLDVGAACTTTAPGACKLGTCARDADGGASCHPFGCGDFAP